ncbi:MAG: NADH-quinone oxidoreductase subunit L [Rickettsiales bacterium]|nr:NADH-quinone oxidoreductase subunit L [Rickettsiales bacterium]
MSLSEMIVALVFIPLLSAMFVGLSVRRIADTTAQYITAGGMIVSAILSLIIFDAVALNQTTETVTLLPWIHSGQFAIDWALRVDALTAVMFVVVTVVSAVVHVYSIGYMSHDAHKPRFMCYLSLFTFCMLMLVTADNFVQLFFGWEGVGLCSYLLIGFWFQKDSANEASMKAFIVNRVGDFGFALGIMAVFAVFGTVQFDAVFAAAATHADTMMTFLNWQINTMDIICILLFVGAMGKSAQLLLHTWLPDAMEGPTPVSALIHAATMVTAGVFMVARISPMMELAPTALMVVTLVGAATAFFAATVGMVQNDIKRVIAYSTCSQLGYMFFACGVGAYQAAIFHLMTHAFFKALLFLGAGSVIHAMSNEQDMRKMGGIWKEIPYTYAFMWIGSLALAGLPFFAGYYSKDIILEVAYAAHTQQGEIAFWLGIGAAIMTAFYSWRLIFMTFHGRPRASQEVMSHIHESPRVMLLPLVVLAIGALGAGAYGYKIGMVAPNDAFWGAAIPVAGGDHPILEEAHHVPKWVMYLPIVVALLGIFAAYVAYMKKTNLPAKCAKSFSWVYKFMLNKWYFDELYDFLFVKPAQKKGLYLWKFWDTKVIDGLGPNGAAWLSDRVGKMVSNLQTGFVYHYAFAMLLGLVALLSWLFLFQIGGAS